jgi:hypothetical protein
LGEGYVWLVGEKGTNGRGRGGEGVMDGNNREMGKHSRKSEGNMKDKLLHYVIRKKDKSHDSE